jgi:iron complex outermembrane receptor protein
MLFTIQNRNLLNHLIQNQLSMNKHLLFPFRSLLCICFVFLAVGFSYGQKKVTGTLTDRGTGDPLIGANIVIKGTTAGTVADFNGSYTIMANPGDVLVFTYTGYKAQELTVGSESVYNVAMDAGELFEEVVVIGYGSVRKADLTGSVVAVGENDFNKGVYTSPEQLIQGKAAGVQVINNSGQPGGLTTVRIRGNSSIRAGNQPLYVVDGVQMSGASSSPGANSASIGDTPGLNPLNYLNPNDISSIQVLKDASSTAIYGSRGANGVIIITTKKGRVGSPSLDVNSSVGFSSVLKKYDVLSADEYRSALTEYNLTTGDYGSSVDAQDEIFQTGRTDNHSIALNGGNSDGSYRISLGYLNQEGVVRNNELRRLSANLGGGYQLLENKRLGIDFNLFTSQTREDGPAITTNADFRGSLIGNALQWNPTHKLYNDDGSPVILPAFGNFTNPVALLDAYEDQSNTVDLIASISPSYKLTDDLTYRLTYSITHGTGRRAAQFASWINVQDVEGRGIAGISDKTVTNQILTHTLNYNHNITSGLNLDAVLGFEYQNLSEKGSGFFAKDFIVEDFNYTNILQNSSQSSRNVYGYQNPTTELQSYFLRTGFNFSDRFLVTLTGRLDGSSKFGENNKYAFFPAVGAAWNLHTEDFLSGGAFDQLKLRVGWGQVGNSEFPAGSAQERYSFNQGTIALTNVANPDLKWETTTTFNIGVDFGVMDSKLSGSVEYFHKDSKDLLFQFPTIQPAPAGFYWINLDGDVINSGVEVALNLLAVDKSTLKWNIGGNVSFLKNELQDYTGPNIPYGQVFGQGSSGATTMLLQSGQPLNSFYLREHLGIGDNGQSTYRDDETLFFLGDANPDIILGISTSLDLGKLDISLNFNGAMGHQIFNNTKMSVIPIGNLGSRNIDASLLEGDVQEATSNAIKASSRYLENGDYVKLSNASVSYNIGKIGNTFRNSRIYLSGQNLLVFTNYSGFDPEVNTVNIKDGLPSLGIEYIPYPSARTVTLGVNFTL